MTVHRAGQHAIRSAAVLAPEFFPAPKPETKVPGAPETSPAQDESRGRLICLTKGKSPCQAKLLIFRKLISSVFRKNMIVSRHPASARGAFGQSSPDVERGMRWTQGIVRRA